MKNKKKGFTLVELIVVLAILAILAAMLVPALTGYIDKANEKKAVAAARQYAIAAQSVVSDAYASNDVVTKIENNGTTTTVTVDPTTNAAALAKAYDELAEMKSGDKAEFTFTKEKMTAGEVTSGGKIVKYNSTTGTWAKS